MVWAVLDLQNPRRQFRLEEIGVVGDKGGFQIKPLFEPDAIGKFQCYILARSELLIQFLEDCVCSNWRTGKSAV